jgi:hypothetical protein
MDVNKIIRGKLHVKRGESLPFVGWGGLMSRIDLAKLFGELGYKTGAEVGVRKGEYSRTICDNVPGVRLSCIDPWAPYEGRRPSQERMDLYYQATQNTLKGFDVEFIRKPSLEAANGFADGSLDFVYIDAMHYFDDVMMDIITWTPKVRAGGIVSGHDYAHWYGCGVLDAVKAYTHAHHITAWYLTNTKDKAGTPSWFWVR